MGIFDSLFGKQGGFASQDKQRSNGLYDQYGAAANDAYSPAAVRSQVANFSGNLYKNLDTQEMAGRHSLASRGFSSPNAALYGELPASQVAAFGANAQQDARKQRLMAILQQMGLLDQVAKLNYNQPTNGILPGIMSAAGSIYGMSNGGGGGSSNSNAWNGQSPYGNATPPLGTVPWNANEGSGQGAW